MRAGGEEHRKRAPEGAAGRGRCACAAWEWEKALAKPASRTRPPRRAVKRERLGDAPPRRQANVKHRIAVSYDHIHKQQQRPPDLILPWPSQTLLQ